MSKAAKASWREKVQLILSSAFGERAKRIGLGAPCEAIAAALTKDMPSDRARDIAFHLTDWSGDAAFLVAITLFPERFTRKEIREGVGACLSHIPNHVAAAATLGEWEMRDIFEVGARIEPPAE